MVSPPNLWDRQPEWVTEEEIRRAFNQGGFLERAQRGELHQKALGYNTHLNRRQRLKFDPPEPRCTRSQMVLYCTPEGQPVALVHQYKRGDGSIGASGRPDPKRLFLDEHVMAVRQSR